MPDTEPQLNPLLALRGNESDEEEDDEEEELTPTQLDLDAAAAEDDAMEVEDAARTTAELTKDAREKEMKRYSDAIKAGNVIFIHLDLETGGEKVGVIQLSSIAHDSGTNEKVGETFNEYVQPSARVLAELF